MNLKWNIILLVVGLFLMALPQISHWMAYETNLSSWSCILGLLELAFLIFAVFSYPLGSAFVLLVAVRWLLRGPLASHVKMTQWPYSALVVPITANAYMVAQSLVFVPYLPYPLGTTTQPLSLTALSVAVTVTSIIWAIVCMSKNRKVRCGIAGIVLSLLPVLTCTASFHLIIGFRAWMFKPPKSVDKQPETMQLAIDDKTSIDLIYIGAGSFIMGRDTRFERTMFGRVLFWLSEPPFAPYSEGPPRRVKITKGFYIGKYEITTQQFCKFLNTVPNPEDNFRFNKYARIEKKDNVYVPKTHWENCQMTIVHWRGAAAFCQWLSQRAGLTVRLPTEAEWEYVARKPISRPYPWGWENDDDPNKLATPDVDGVVGMPGGIGEWCSDFYGIRYLRNDCVDPEGPREEDLLDKSVNPFDDDERYHVLRCGMSVTSRWFGNVAGDSVDHGFRIVVMPVEESR